MLRGHVDINGGFDDMLRPAWDMHVREAEWILALCTKLQRVAGDMQRWARTEFGSVQKKIKLLRDRLDVAR